MWCFKIRQPNGTVKRVRGCSDLKATEGMASEAERKVARTRAGLIDPAEAHARRPLAEHLKDYAAYLEAKGTTERHARAVVSCCRTIFNGCGFSFVPDIDAGKTGEWLHAYRRGRTPVAIPPGESFAPGTAAKVLGISGTAIAASVKRHGLAASGSGKARRFPRATVEAIATHGAKECGPETVNHFVRAAKAFGRWLMKSRRFNTNPFDALVPLNAAVDVRHARRDLTADELHRLFDATQASTFRGLSGQDRYTLYLVAAGTGFRANALANLTPSDTPRTAE